DDVAAIELLEGILQRPASTFCGVALPPCVTRERPADFEPGPSFRIQKTDPADHPPAGFFLDGPMAVPPQLPVTDEKSHAAPRLAARQHLARPQVLHDQWI